MYRLDVTMKFTVHNRDQAKFIVKQLGKVRKLASNLSICPKSSMSSSITKIDTPAIRKIG